MGSIVDISEVLLEAGLAASATETERAIFAQVISRVEGLVIQHLRYDPVQRTRTEFYPLQELNLSGSDGVWQVNASAAYFERANQVAGNELQVRHVPIRQRDSSGDGAIDLRLDYGARSGTNVGSFSESTQKTEGVDFWPNYDQQDSSGYGVCRDGILRSHGRWPVEPGSVKITYLAGYTSAELHGQDSAVNARPILDAVLTESIRQVGKVYSRMKKARGGFGVGPLSGEDLGDYAYTTNGDLMSSIFGTGESLLSETRQSLSEFVNYGWAIGG